jgi:hypothetical protein
MTGRTDRKETGAPAKRSAWIRQDLAVKRCRLLSGGAISSKLSRRALRIPSRGRCEGPFNDTAEWGANASGRMG